MGAAVSITRLDLTASELRKAASGEKDGAAARRNRIFSRRETTVSSPQQLLLSLMEHHLGLAAHSFGVCSFCMAFPLLSGAPDGPFGGSPRS
jgi:hypothetical protein